MKKSKLILTIVGIAATGALSAQLTIQRSVIASSGSNTTGPSSITASWTAGEAVTGTTTGSSITLTQGFQQPDKDPIAIHEPEAGIDLKVYPNPTDGWVFIEADAKNAQILHYSVFTINGRKVNLSGNTLQVHGHTKKQLDFSQLAQGTYVLRIISAKGKQLAAIRIIKTF